MLSLAAPGDDVSIRSVAGPIKALDLNHSRNYDGLAPEFPLDKALQVNSQIFLEYSFVSDLRRLHFLDGLSDRRTGLSVESVSWLKPGDALKRYLRLT